MAREELQRLMYEPSLRDAILLVFANKQDLPNGMYRKYFDISEILLLLTHPIAVSPAELTDRLGLHLMRHTAWYVQPACAASGDGLYNGLVSLSQCYHYIVGLM